MQTSADGRAFITREEGCLLHSYQDEAGVWTIGVGHTGIDVTPQRVITLQQAEEILTEDLKRFERCVNSETRLPPRQCEFDAMVSLAFNIGVFAFEKSTVLRAYNRNDLTGAANAFLLWNKITVKGEKIISKCLVNRRARERQLFLS